MEPFRQARKYITALMSDLPHKNGWTIAEHAGDATPDRTRRLLNHAVWDTGEAMSVVRRFVAGHLAYELMVGALDVSGQQKQGVRRAGMKRQYMGCADAGIKVVLSGVRMPRMNAIMERWGETYRRELLDRTLIWNQRHLLHALQEYERFYNTHREHHRLAQRRQRCLFDCIRTVAGKPHSR